MRINDSSTKKNDWKNVKVSTFCGGNTELLEIFHIVSEEYLCKYLSFWKVFYYSIAREYRVCNRLKKQNAEKSMRKLHK